MLSSLAWPPIDTNQVSSPLIFAVAYLFLLNLKFHSTCVPALYFHMRHFYAQEVCEHLYTSVHTLVERVFDIRFAQRFASKNMGTIILFNQPNYMDQTPFQKVTVSQLFKRFLTFCVIRTFISVCTPLIVPALSYCLYIPFTPKSPKQPLSLPKFLYAVLISPPSFLKYHHNITHIIYHNNKN